MPREQNTTLGKLSRNLGYALLSLATVIHSGCITPRRLDEPKISVVKNPVGLRAQYYGASTIFITDGDHGILIDGFFSRPPLTHAFTGFESDLCRIKRILTTSLPGRVDAIFVAHAHHDHALDAGVIAKIKDAELYVPTELVSSLPEHALKVRSLADNLAVDVKGAFKIKAYKTRHATPPMFMRVLDELTFLPGIGQFRAKENYTFYIEHKEANVLISPSAALPEGGLAEINPHVAFISIAYVARMGARDAETYFQGVLKGNNLKLVIPIHWDNLMGEAKEPLSPTPRPIDNVWRAAEHLKSFARNDKRRLHVGYPTIAEPFSLSAHKANSMCSGPDPASSSDYSATPSSSQ